MKKHIWLASGLLLLLGSLAAQPAGRQSLPAIDATAAYARLNTLAGEWEADTNMGKARITYELIAGGSALSERETMENMPPMQTVYHLDGKRLL
jgi:hypothetical protein